MSARARFRARHLRRRPRRVARRRVALASLSAGALLVACEQPLRDGGPEPLDGPAWEVQVADTSISFIGMWVVSEQVVWVSGPRGRWGRTTDGGATWSFGVVPGAESLGFRDVHAFSEREAVLLSIGSGPASRIYVTEDGGESWTLSFANEDQDAFFDCLSFWDRDRGLAFSDSHEGEFTLIRTDDGGTTWSRIDPATVPDARPGEGAFASSGTCVVTRPGGLGWFATGASGVDTRVIRTRDYGATWEEALTPIASDAPASGIFSLAFLDDTLGVAAGGDDGRKGATFDDVALTVDGGRTWTLGGRTGLGGAVYGVSFVPGAPTPTLVVVNPAGSAWSADRGATWARIDSLSYWTVGFAAPGAGWAAGPGRIARIRWANVP